MSEDKHLKGLIIEGKRKMANEKKNIAVHKA